eukprot:7473038-Pyramimonas_sp.AAC.1
MGWMEKGWGNVWGKVWLVRKELEMGNSVRVRVWISGIAAQWYSRVGIDSVMYGMRTWPACCGRDF